MKNLHAVLLAAAALCALTVGNAYAGSAGATTSVTSNVAGNATTTGNATAVVVGVNTGTATAVAVKSPTTVHTTTSAVDAGYANSKSHVTSGTALGNVSATGHAAAAAWTTP